MSQPTAPSLWQRTIVYIQVQLFRLLGRLATLGTRLPKIFPPSRELYIPSADGKRQIKVLIFDPPNAPPGPKPVYINFHGSGFIIEGLGIDGRLLTYLAREVGCIVVDGDYRKAPEYPFPAGYDDARSVVSWVLENKNGEFDVDRVAVGGMSAGGKFALSLVVTMPPNTFKAVTVIVPPTDFAMKYCERKPPPAIREEHKKESDRGGPIPPKVGEMMRSAYLGSFTNTKDPRLSPAYGDVTRFPGPQRVFIAWAEYDYVGEEARVFKDRLVEAGKDPVFLYAEGMGHGYIMSNETDTAAAKMRDETFAKIAETLKRGFAS